ncbi:uncharacterized protein LOC124644335 isoform X1 [Helicoverpa zea]|uniref:uncharacterized protein LOC124644335 isoform X1 n=1 Tax=Helicoverpa zea TaxID=7113 RepID=UPI001F565460|nr:uncharacterized protein LOC124644335 isoform X1 [Helicoverpa zea]XP_047039599.1 uncharacterized protein LOC124644335 isoform X1 [Helicoverpa zea]
MPFCTVCNTSVERNHWVGHLRSNDHKNKNISHFCEGVEIIHSAFRNRIASYRITDSFENCSLESFLNNIQDKIQMLIDMSLKEHTCLKVNFEYFALFLLVKNESQEMKSFCTKNFSLYQNYDYVTLISQVENTLKKKIEEFQDRDSGWTLLSSSHLEININKYQPLRGSGFIELPAAIKSKRACVNIHNNDEYCFLWSVVAALYPAKSHPERVLSYPHFRNVLNIEGLSFPLSFSDIAQFEVNNPEICIYIYGLKNNTVVGPLYKPKSLNNKKVIHLLYLQNDNLSHYCLIKDLPRLVKNQITKHHSKLYFCEECLMFFDSCDDLSSHSCGGIATVLPPKGSFIQFENYNRKQTVPFVIYADFETMLERYQSCDPDPTTASTVTRQRHVPIAFAYHITCTLADSHNRYVSYRGLDCVSKFVKSIYNDAQKIYGILKSNVPIIFTDDHAHDFENAATCHICEHFLFGDKVRDHCHLTGKYRGAAHSYCNIQYKVPSFIPVFFHNLSGYDCHLFIKELGEAPGSLKVIPKTKENYISFTKFIPISPKESIQVRFVDSFKFLGTSLEKLTSTMKIQEFQQLKSHFPIETQFSLLTRKGVYPYDYMSQWERYEDTCLPSKNHFYNSLTNELISDEDYEHAQSVWSVFNIQNMGMYTDLYLKTDVLLLTDIFESFRKTCKRYYNLDPAFYLTAPSLSFDAMLLKTGVKLELISDVEIFRMIQKGIRGGVCMCSRRHAKANNKYLDSYDTSSPNSFIIYLDCNNLYGYSMCQALPYSDFRFMNRKEIDDLQLNLTNISDTAEKGYILEVDLMYPRHLHIDHNDFPFCPEKCLPPGGNNKKLIPNLYDKYQYVIHYAHLKKCLQHGLVLKKIHRAIEFKQSCFLKQYIDLNTQLRQKAESTFEQDFFKLLNNSIFGKTLENNEQRIDVKLVNKWCDSNNKTKKTTCAEKLIASPYFHSASVFSDNLVAIQMKPSRVILNKPIYIGFAVLELSKSHMYDFHYSTIKPFYGNRIQLCYTDTDSLVYKVETNDIYKDFKMHFLKYLDTSNYDSNNEFELPIINKKIPGLFKDEMGGKIIKEFVGLRSKLYCIKTLDKTIKKAKGTKKCITKQFKMTDYKSVLYNCNVIRKKNILFRSIKHEIFTQNVNKVALSSNDDKRLLLFDKVSTLAWGNATIFM